VLYLHDFKNGTPNLKRGKGIHHVAHFLGWLDYVLIGWVLISAIAASFVGRFLANALREPAKGDTEPEAQPIHPETATGTGLQACRFSKPFAISQSGNSSETSITKRS
jgi:hypothetical protein